MGLVCMSEEAAEGEGRTSARSVRRRRRRRWWRLTCIHLICIRRKHLGRDWMERLSTNFHFDCPVSADGSDFLLLQEGVGVRCASQVGSWFNARVGKASQARARVPPGPFYVFIPSESCLFLSCSRFLEGRVSPLIGRCHLVVMLQLGSRPADTRC